MNLYFLCFWVYIVHFYSWICSLAGLGVRHTSALKCQPTTFVFVLLSYIYDPALEISFHKAFLKYLKSIIVSPVQLWKVFWSQKKKLPWKLTQTWKVTHWRTEGREVEIWDLYQNNNFLMSICTCSVAFLFGHGFRAPVYLQLSLLSLQCSFFHTERRVIKAWKTLC